MSEGTKLKRFVVMGGMIYYASGGFEDYLGSFDLKEDGEKFMNDYLEKSGGYHWAHIADIETGEFWAKGVACNPMKMFR